MSTSFYQYQYCSLCKKNHKQRRKKHIYSKRHQDVLRSILSKFRVKITDAKTLLSNPAVRERGWEVDSGIWCYFCETEVKKHKSEDDCVLVLGGFLQHLASVDHSKNTGAFFYQNVIPMDRKPEFIISSEDYNRFILLADQATSSFRENLEQEIKKEAAKIAEADARSQTLRWTGMKEQLLKQSLGSCHDQVNVLRQHPAKQSEETIHGKKTVAAFGKGLTCIMQQEADDGRAEVLGNVFTGAMPPWLMEDEEKGGREIGPTVEDYKKHLERQKRLKLPACRVGAKFDRTVDTSSEWLPSFGRVWNQGRRLNSRHQYLNEKRHMRTATITAKEIKSQGSVVNQAGANGPTSHSVRYQGHSSADQAGRYGNQKRDPSVQLFTNHHDNITSGNVCNMSCATLADARPNDDDSVNLGTFCQGVTLTKTLNRPPALLDNFPPQSDHVNFSASSPIYVMPYKRRHKSSISETPAKYMGLISIASSFLQKCPKKICSKKT